MKTIGVKWRCGRSESAEPFSTARRAAYEGSLYRQDVPHTANCFHRMLGSSHLSHVPPDDSTRGQEGPGLVVGRLSRSDGRERRNPQTWGLGEARSPHVEDDAWWVEMTPVVRGLLGRPHSFFHRQRWCPRQASRPPGHRWGRYTNGSRPLYISFGDAANARADVPTQRKPAPSRVSWCFTPLRRRDGQHKGLALIHIRACDSADAEHPA